jgi:hypothetical protein
VTLQRVLSRIGITVRAGFKFKRAQILVPTIMCEIVPKCRHMKFNK